MFNDNPIRYGKPQPNHGLMVLVACMFFLAMIFVSGCSSNQRVNYSTMNDTFITTVQVLVDARLNGEFTSEEWTEDIFPLIEQGDAALTIYDELTKSGEDTGSVLAEINRILLALEPFFERATRSLE